MKSLNKYSKNNFSFINSIQSRIENPMITEEYELDIVTNISLIAICSSKINKTSLSDSFI